MIGQLAALRRDGETMLMDPTRKRAVLHHIGERNSWFAILMPGNPTTVNWTGRHG
jgi:hypothetical protein